MPTTLLTDLREHFDRILSQLESVAGWQTARVRRPVLILGNLDGIETGIRQLIRQAPLETTVLDHQGVALTVPTVAETLRIKGVLILRRNATRDYLDFAALSEQLGGDDIDFEVELIHRDNINVSYILELVIRMRNTKPDEYHRHVQAIISMLESEPERRTVGERIIGRIVSYVDTFIDGMD